DVRPEDESLVHLLTNIGVLIGQFIERKRAEEDLRESEARFRDMADSAPVLIWMSGPDKIYTYFNQRWLDFTGRTLQSEIKDTRGLGMHALDRHRYLVAYDRAFDAREEFEIEYRLMRRDGAYVWVLDRGSPRFNARGEFLGYIGSCVDISER